MDCLVVGHCLVIQVGYTLGISQKCLMTAEEASHNSNTSYLIFTLILADFRVPYSYHNVSGTEMEIWVVRYVIHADILLHTNNLEAEEEKKEAKNKREIILIHSTMFRNLHDEDRK